MDDEKWLHAIRGEDVGGAAGLFNLRVHSMRKFRDFAEPRRHGGQNIEYRHAKIS
jgi:hypothetical protein